MLSYLKEGQAGVPASNQVNAAAPQNANPSLSKKEDYLTVSGHGKKLKQSTYFLAGLFVIGGLCLWLMIKKAAPAAASAASKPAVEQAQIDTVIAQLNGMQTEIGSQMKTMTGRIHTVTEVGQVGVSELQKNPFVQETAVSDSGIPDTLAQKQILEAKLRHKAAGMELLSITASGGSTICMINDTVLRVGDSINGFTVKEITPTTVSLEESDVQIQLKMQ